MGDRIKIGPVTGDVIEVGYFDTTLWEFGGTYISGDHPSGRLIRFQNSRIFNEYVYNYSWPLFPYLWNEIKFYISYDSDLGFVEKTIARIVDEDLAEEMRQRIESYQELLEETPVEALKVRDKPAVFFRTSENTWVEVVVRYLVESGADIGRNDFTGRSALDWARRNNRSPIVRLLETAEAKSS